MESTSGAAQDGAITTVDGYLARFVPDLAARLTREIRPLYDPSKESWHPALHALTRKPFRAQGDAVMGLHRVLARQKFAILVGECGVGKTLMGSALSAVLLPGRGRVLVMCPGHLVEKWAREIKETVPGSVVRIAWRVSDLFDLKRGSKPRRREYVILARDRAKLGFRRKPAYILRRQPCQRMAHGEKADLKTQYVACPSCATIVVDPKTHRPLIPAELAAKVEYCGKCKGALWQADRTGVRRFAPAEYIKRRLKGVFDLFIADEVHELKGADTAQGNTLGMLAAACKKTVCLTGTLVGGYAEHLFYILYRVNPRGMRGAENLKYSQVQNWIARYGALEFITKKPASGDALAYARGSKQHTYVKHRPGVSPLAFARHLLTNSVFVELADVAEELPSIAEDVAVIPMSEELRDAYKEIETSFKRVLADRSKAMRYMGAYLATLLSYPDRPFDNKRIPEVGTPKELSKDAIYPKEKALLDFIVAERAARRRVWVFATFTNTRDVTERLRALLAKRGLKAAILRQDTVEMAQREAWIAEQCKRGVDVVISNPELVKTGLDLLEFPSLAFYETGFNTFTLMQASRRSWRVGQKAAVKVKYFCFKDTLQEAALRLMGAKVKATMALQGKFSAEGLTALTQSEDMMSALAKALTNGLEGVESAESYWRSSRTAGKDFGHAPANVAPRESPVQKAERLPPPSKPPAADLVVVTLDLFASLPASRADAPPRGRAAKPVREEQLSLF